MSHPISGRTSGEVITDPDVLKALCERNNPKNEPVGHFTGRCFHCGSGDLWDDNLAYGCNCCGALLNVGEELVPRIVYTGLEMDRDGYISFQVFLLDPTTGTPR